MTTLVELAVEIDKRIEPKLDIVKRLKTLADCKNIPRLELQVLAVRAEEEKLGLG